MNSPLQLLGFFELRIDDIVISAALLRAARPAGSAWRTLLAVCGRQAVSDLLEVAGKLAQPRHI